MKQEKINQDINLDFDFECKKCDFGWFAKNYKTTIYKIGKVCPNCNLLLDTK